MLGQLVNIIVIKELEFSSQMITFDSLSSN